MAGRGSSFDPSDVVGSFRRHLRAAGTSERAEQEQRYLKSSLQFYGASAPVIRGLARDFDRAHPELGRTELRALAQALWDTDHHELRQVGTAILARRQAQLRPADLPMLERFLRRSASWAHVDFLATAVIAPIVGRSPGATRVLDRWARDANFWLRRAALLALLPGLKRGSETFDQFIRYSVPMLTEREFFIRKAIGWVLREVSKSRPELVRTYIGRYGDGMSGLTLREATKYLPRAPVGHRRDGRRTGRW